MVHLQTNTSIVNLVLFSLLTFFIMPTITSPYLTNMEDPCPIGFILGFIISLILWKIMPR